MWHEPSVNKGPFKKYGGPSKIVTKCDKGEGGQAKE